VTPAHRVVLVGGGFAGLTTATALRRAPVDITLLDRRNFHLFQPLLYQVATGGLSPANIAAPLRGVLKRQTNCTVLLAEVKSIDPKRKFVLSNLGEHAYDTLLIATGASHAYFGHPEWEQSAPGLKTLEDALAIRSKVLLAFERAEATDDLEHRRRLLTFVIVGAGPTGAELAGAIAEMARHTLRGNFRHFDSAMAQVILLEGGPRVLAAYPPQLSLHAHHALQRLGVEVILNAKVTDITGDCVTYERAGQVHQLHSDVILWGAGVQGSPLGEALAQGAGCSLDRQGRVMVNPDLTVPGHPDILVLGDLARLDQDGQPIPGVAPAAMQMGRYAARLIQARLRGHTLKPFRYHNKGTMATLGRGAAVADLGSLRLHGYPAWLAWLFLHLLFLVGFESKLLVLIQWAWNYITRARSARLIADTPVT
jgi:NADH dehydrogenase